MEEDLEFARCQARVGRTLNGKWHLDSLIGIGGMAAVYAASHRNSATAAIKILHPSFARNAEARTRFLREAYIANKAGKGAVTVLDDDIDDHGAPYLVMELLRGEPVDVRAERTAGKLPLAEVMWIATQTLAVLEAAHAHGIVHRDLKPENLFWTNDGRLKVLDFGIARLRDAGADHTRAGMVMGTPGFMAPEQALGNTEDIDARTDIWSVGAIIFKLLSGREVHEGAGNAVVIAATRHAPSLSTVSREAPPDLVRIVDRALAFERGKRYLDARSMREDLDKLVAKNPVYKPVSVARMPAAAVAASVAAAAESAQRIAAAAEIEAEPSSRRGFATQMSSADTMALRALFKSIEKAIQLRARNGAKHADAVRATEAAQKYATQALGDAHIGLFWHVGAEEFTAGKGELLWKPAPPLDGAPRRLYADGVRMLGILPGISLLEFSELLRILGTDLGGDGKPIEDLAEVLRKKAMQHVVFELDPFADGRSATQPGQRDGRSATQPGQHRDEKPTQPKKHKTQSPVAQARVDTQAMDARFRAATASAYVAAHELGGTAHLVDRIRGALDGLATSAPRDAVGFIRGICEAVEAEGRAAASSARPGRRTPDSGSRGARGKEGLGIAFAREVISVQTMKLLLAAVASPQAGKSDLPAHLAALLGFVGSAHLDAAIDTLTTARDPALRDTLLAYVERAGAGSETAIARRLRDASADLAMDLLRVLRAIGTPEAKAAIAKAAADTPHRLVRVAALSSSADGGGDLVRSELRRLLEDPDPAARVAALTAIERHKVKTAGPALALRIRAPGFDALPSEERRQALLTLSTLMPSRAEAMALELLADQNLIPSDAHEQTRAIAVELLGRTGTSKETKDALAAASKSRWKSSERVRTAAVIAFAAFELRALNPPSSKKAKRKTTHAPSMSKPSPSKPPPPPSKRTGSASKRPPPPSKRTQSPSKRPPPPSRRRP